MFLRLFNIIIHKKAKEINYDRFFIRTLMSRALQKKIWFRGCGVLDRVNFNCQLHNVVLPWDDDFVPTP